MCFVWISEQTAIISLYFTNTAFIIETVCLLHVTDWTFKYNSVQMLVFKRYTDEKITRQASQCMYNGTLKLVRANNVALGNP